MVDTYGELIINLSVHLSVCACVCDVSVSLLSPLTQQNIITIIIELCNEIFTRCCFNNNKVTQLKCSVLRHINHTITHQANQLIIDNEMIKLSFFLMQVEVEPWCL